MPARLKKLIKTFSFPPNETKNVTLGSDVRHNVETHRLQLKAATDGTFPLTADLFAKTRVTTLRQLKNWLGFEVSATIPTDDLGDPLSSLGFRLSDGVDEFRWDGANWVVNTTAWNTEAEVADNIDQFPVTSQSIQVVINFVTTDAAVTPELLSLKLLFESEIEFQEDYIWRSLIPDLRAKVRPISDHPFNVPAPARTTLDLKDDFPLQTPYNIVGIDSVYNDTADPLHLNDIFSGFDVGTLVVTLSESIGPDEVAWVRFLYEPVVAVTTGQEYSEIAKIPAIIITEIQLIESGEVAQPDSVANISQGTAVQIPGPLEADIQITMRILTDSAKDQVRLADEMKRYFMVNPLLRSKGLDELFRLWLIDEYRQTTNPSQKEIHSGRLRFRIVKALFFERPAEDVFITQQFVITGTPDVVVS